MQESSRETVPVIKKPPTNNCKFFIIVILSQSRSPINHPKRLLKACPSGAREDSNLLAHTWAQAEQEFFLLMTLVLWIAVCELSWTLDYRLPKKWLLGSVVNWDNSRLFPLAYSPFFYLSLGWSLTIVLFASLCKGGKNLSAERPSLEQDMVFLWGKFYGGQLEPNAWDIAL